MNLTDEQLNIAICEWRGWKRDNDFKRDHLWINGEHHVDSDNDLPSHITGIEALGNMHEAEKGLTHTQLWEYNRALRDAIGVAAGIGSGGLDEWTWHATARQRAIALLRVVNPEATK